MSKYKELDRLIINKLGGSPTPFHKIYAKDVATESERLAAVEGKSYPFRFVDNRLQALRKSRAIRNVKGKGWVRI